MKRLLFFICTLLCANVLMAQTWFWIDSLQYEVTSTNPAEVEVYDANYSITTANIPATVTYQGTDYSVTSIGEEAFRVCSNLTSVTIPNSVTSIGEKAFMYCRSLTSVTIPNSVTTIGRYTFYNCSSLTSVTIPNSVTSIGYVAFAYCSSLTSVTIPNSVTSIGISAFKECSSLTSIDIPNSVTSIGGSAFDNCSSLTSVTIPNSVTSIGNYAFERCSSLTSVTIPNSVTSIGNYAFSFCSSLTSVILPNNANISSSAFESTGGIKVGGISYGGKETVNIGNYTFNNVGFITFYLNGNATTITPSEVSVIDCDESLSGDIVISSILSYQGINIAVTSIGDEAFEFCSSLTSVTIPNSVTSIGGSAFDNCSSLTSITIPNSVTSIGNSVFWNCSSLTSVTIPNSVTSIGNYAFGYCSSLYSVTIPNSVTSIGDYAFNHCSSLTSVTCLKETAPSLGSSVFFITPSTKVLNIPCGSNYSSWESATDWASVECTWNLGNSLTYFPLTFAIISGGERTMKVSDCDTSATVVEIPARVMYNGELYDVTSIGYYAFSGCSSLTSVDIPNSVTSIGNSAFYDCSSLTSVNIPNSVTSIGNQAFLECSSLTSVTIGNSVTSIGNSAFSGCHSLTSVTIPNSVTSIGEFAFASCDSLASVTIGNSVTSIGNGAFRFCNNLTSVTIGNSVTSIGSFAFWDCTSLTSIDIPNSVTSIGNGAFAGCSSLTSVNIPNSVTSIGNQTFSGCSNLTSVNIPNSVTSIGDEAFSGCISLTSVNIPNSVTSIGNSAFQACFDLTSVTCLAETAPSLGNNVFASTPSTKTLTVPCESDYSSWESATTWASVERIGCEEEECVDVFTIGDLTYEKTSATEVSVKDCSETATEVIIPASVEQCGITYSVTDIGNYAFRNCSSLTSVTIPNSITYIGFSAFADCSSLTTINFNAINCEDFEPSYPPFYHCPISTINIGDSVQRIPGYFIGSYFYGSPSSLTSITIPNSVTSIGECAFYGCKGLTSVTLPENITYIGSSAFYKAGVDASVIIDSVTYKVSPAIIPDSYYENVTGYYISGCGLITFYIGDSTYAPTEAMVYSCNLSRSGHVDILSSIEFAGNAYPVTSIGQVAFSSCYDLTSVTIPNSVTSIGHDAFYGCHGLTSVTIPNSVTSIGYDAFRNCSSLDSVICLAETAPTLGDRVFYTNLTKTLTVPFGSDYSSWQSATDWAKINYLIQEGETKTLANDFTINATTGLINQGTLVINQNGQLINETGTNVSGIFEIETPTLANDKWSFIGAPFNNYKLEVVKPGTKDISISLFDYTTGNWAENFATIEDSVGSGEGFFAWSFAEEPTVFTTYGDGAEVYDFTQLPAYKINNGAVNVTKNLTTNAEGGNWLALSNPYTFKLDVEKFLSEHGDIKGGEVYRFNGSVWTLVSEGEINMTEGFFVNFENPGTHSVSFSKYYIYEPAKSKAIEAKDYITLNVAEGENVSKLRFAQNPKAKQGDDIFDANKLFSPLEITEPYFVTDGVALVKEEVKEYPYTATLNIRNYETKEITLSIDNIPEGLNVYLIDNGYEVKMNGGVEYNTRIIAGENADRFKVLFKKQHRLEKIKDNQISITNNNRQISVKSDKTDLNIEVYNQLGQKVFSTNEYNFTLSEQPAGSYVIKAYQGRFSESKKIVIE